MINQFLTKLMGDPNGREIKRALARVAEINAREAEVAKLKDAELPKRTAEFKARLAKGESLDSLLPEAFALVREAAKRVLGQRHFDEQLVGGVVLHEGKIAEMRTGEGKTLVATAPAFLNALEGHGVHVVTVNDYLARRDSGWMGQVYHALGLTTAAIIHDQSVMYDPEFNDPEATDPRLVHLKPVSRREAYQADVTYGVNNEFGFDYLRDNMVGDAGQMVQRPLAYAIVDEVDSILIDEARTPLIISAPSGKPTERYYAFAKIARGLVIETDYTVDEKLKAVSLTDEGITKIEKILGVENVYQSGGLDDVHHIEQSLKAEALFKRDRDYVVREGEIIIVDEFTGRLLLGRRYSEGLHQAIEAKEGVEIKQESQTLATITFQNLFRLYDKLSGMTGTAATEAEEFGKIYELEVTTIPTHQEMIRIDNGDKIYKNERAKFEAIARDVRERNSKGQPVLIGTVSIDKNEVLSAVLTEAGVKHQVLNAKNNEAEAAIVAAAGQKGSVVLATNIAGRGTDIVLGEGVAKLGGLHVIGSERHESRRIDNQLRGRAGRQGDQGSSQFYVSLDDDLMRIFGSDRIAGLMNTLGLPDDVPIENAIVSRSIESAQKKVEGHYFDIRKQLVEYDDVLNKHREAIYGLRRQVLTSADLKAETLGRVEAAVSTVVQAHTDTRTGLVDGDNVYEQVNNFVPLDEGIKKLLEKADTREAEERLVQRVREVYAEREKQFGEANMRLVERAVSLQMIDTLWLEHLEAIEHLRTGIGLRGYGQRDPLVEYKGEAFRLFQQLRRLIDSEIAGMIFRVSVTINPPQQAVETNLTQAAKTASAIGPDETGTAPTAKPRKRAQAGVVAVSQETGGKVGRNDPCPCGSGLKYKKCGLIGALEHRG